ncbi:MULTISPECIES: hypothetical protein [unclassified Campylobacter]|uniref:hypothetical protein n=1 Tax=unclassified Campylobacter TaxID=2593542 RepID=UPI003D34E1C0
MQEKYKLTIRAGERKRDFVRRVLLTQGCITRNHALRNYISRLGADILILKGEGWRIIGADEVQNSVKTGDYIYTLIEAPQQQKGA